MRRCKLIILGVVIMSTLHFGSARLLATPTQQDVFKSINENVDSTVDLGKAVPYLLVGVALIILAVLYNNRKQMAARPRTLSHPGRLQKELCKAIHLKSAELKQLKTLADEQDLEFALTLLLCPSTLGKAMQSQNSKVDRGILRGIVQRLRESLSRGGSN